jgi:DNA end-binding protein Ku
LVSRGKEQIVIIRRYDGGMLLHGMFYKNEVRDFNEVPKGDSQRMRQEELNLGASLIDQMSNEKFEPEKYRDEYRSRVRSMLDEKVKGHEITAAPAARRKAGGPVIDLMEALKRSLNKDAAPAKTKAATARKRQRKAG